MWPWQSKRDDKRYNVIHHIALYLVRNCPHCGGNDLNPPQYIFDGDRCENCKYLHNALLDAMEI